MDETWLYHYDPETKQQSTEWQHSGSPRPKKFQVQKSAAKVLASIFCDQDGILITDYLAKGQTINAVYYSSLLVQLKDILNEKRRGKVTKGFLFLNDNALAHQALATQKKRTYLGFQCLDLSRRAAAGRLPAEILGSNPTGGMDICTLCVSCVVRYKSLRRADHSSRGVLPTLLCRCV